jgi:protein-disulfide isomerase
MDNSTGSNFSQGKKILLAILGLIVAGSLFLVLEVNRDKKDIAGKIQNNQISSSNSSRTLPMRDDSPTNGPKTAHLTIVEFSDFQCEACAAMSLIMKDVLAKNPNTSDIRYVYRYFPLATHQNAGFAAMLAEAANRSGKFWQMHDLLYQKQDDWKNQKYNDVLNTFSGYAGQLSMNSAIVKADLISGRYRYRINEDQKIALDLKLSGAPTIFLNNEQYGGSLSVDALNRKINQYFVK